MFESKSGVLLVAGIGFFALAFLSNGVVPWILYADRPEKTVEQMLEDQQERAPASTVLGFFQDLKFRYPESFAKHYGEASSEKCAEALRAGHRVYVGEGCWHCHSQFIRPVANEDRRWGPVSQGWEYQNELQRPVLFGTRRVGPDLSREGGTRSNDWHVAHFFRPRMTSPDSIMPDYPWFFDDNRPDGPGPPNRRGIAIILYMQWLGSWLDNFPHYHDSSPSLARELGENR